MNPRPLAPLLCLALAAHLASGASADWNQWRGPQRDGIAPAFDAPAAWTKDTLAKGWSVTVGEGHSSPVVVGDRVYIFARENDREVMRCLAVGDGRVLWQEAYPVPYDMNPAARGHGKGPKATPAIVDGRVFAFGIDGHLSAYEARTGAVLWRKGFAGDFKSPSPVFGASVSPLVDGGRVIVHVGGKNSGALAAFDTATGQERWRWDGDGPAYTSPVIATFGGVRQLVTQSQKHCLALSPDDGKLLWKLPFTTPYEQNIVTPVVAGELVIFGGIQKPTFALKVNGTDVSTAWETREITMYMSSPVLDGHRLYGMSDRQRGVLFTMDVRDGSVLWRGEPRLGENATLTDIGAAILVVTDGGALIVERKNGEALQEVIRYKVAETPVWASPAVTRDAILIKDKTTLTLYRVTGGKG